MAINNKTLSSIQGKVTGLTTNETDFREGIDDTLIQVNATEVLLQTIDSTDITKLAEITATSSELNILNGVTASTSEINILDGVTATTTELNLLDGVTATTAEINILDGLTVSKTELNKLDGFTGTHTDLNKIAAVTATATELNVLDGFTGNTADLNRTVELDAAGNGTANQVLTSDGLGGYTWTTPSSFTFTLEDEDGTEVSIDTDEIKIVGDGMTIDWGTGDGTDGNPYQLQIDNADKGSSQNIFKNILVSGQDDIVADSNDDSLTVVAGDGMAITTNATTDTITFSINNDRRNTSSTTDVYVGNSHDYTFYDASDGIKWYTDDSEKMTLNDDGDLAITGNVTATEYSATSDPKLKKDILKVENALDKIAQLNGYTFKYKKNNKESAGILTTELKEVLPSAVSEVNYQDEALYEVAEYNQLSALFIEAIKELKAEIEDIKLKIS
jgi:hypothetical protein